MRTCEVCGSAYASTHPKARFCSDRCRKRHQRSGGGDPAALLAAEGTGRVLAAWETYLASLGALDTVEGQLALILARRVESPRESGSSVAVLHKALIEMHQHFEAKRVVDDPLDELRRRRDSRRDPA